MEWKDYGFVVISKYRKKVVLALLKHPMTPRQISNETKINISHISRTLHELTRKQIVFCMTPDRVKGRVYSLTEKGTRIAKLIKNNQTMS